MVAILVVLVAVALRAGPLNAVGAKAPYLTFYPAVVIAALYGGLSGGLLATLLCAAAAGYFAEPVGAPFRLRDPIDLLGLAVFVSACVMISLVCEALHRARERAYRAESHLKVTEERQRADEAIEHYELLARHTRDIILFLRKDDGRIVECNEAAETAYLRTRDELCSLTIHDLRLPGDRLLTEWQMDVADTSGALFETIHRRKDGSIFPVEVSSTGSTFSGDRHILSVIRDISKRKQAEDARREAQANVRAIMDASPDYIYLFGIDGVILSANETAAARLGKKAAEIVGRPFTDFVPPEVVEERWAPLKEVAATGKPLRFEDERNGVMFDHTFFPVLGADGAVERIAVFSRNITERKRAEDQTHLLHATVQEEKDRLDALVTSMLDEVWFADTNGTFTLANPSAVREFNLSASGAIGIEELAGSLEVCRGDGSPRPVEEAPPLRALAGEIVRDEEEIVRTPGSGELRYRQVSASPVRDAAGTIIGSISVVRDVTERMRAEDAIRQSEHKYRTLFDTMLEGFCIIEVLFGENEQPVDYRFLEINPSFEAQTGLQNAQGKRMRELAPEHEEYWFEIYGKVALTGEPARFFSEASALNRWYDVSAYKVGGEDSRKVAILFSDVSDSKRVEADLRRKQAELADAQRIAHVGSWYWDKETDATTGSDELHRIFGLDPAKHSMPAFNEQAGTLYPLAEWQRISDAVQTTIQTGIGYELDVQAMRNGTPIWVTTRGEVARGTDGAVTGLHGTVQDITERKRAEERERETEQRLKFHMDFSPLAVVEWNADFVVTMWSEAAVRIFGWEAEEVLGRAISSLNIVFEDDFPIVERTMERLTGGVERTVVSSNRNYTKSGAVIECTWYNSVLLDEDGHMASVMSLVDDITERKQMEEQIRRTAAMLHAIDQSSPDLIYVKDRDSRMLWASQGTLRTIGKGLDELLGRNEAEWHDNPEQAAINMANDRQVMDSAQTQVMEEVFTGPEGTHVYLSTKSPLFDADGIVTGIVGLSTDITERKRAEEELRRLNRTLEALRYSNQAILHANSETEYLNDVCKIIVEDCGHAMVWIGYAEDDENKTVRPVAHSGFENGYLDTLNITWDDCERGRGPTGTAIRTGRPCMCKNMLTDPEFLPWRDEALKRGYASSLVLPMLAGGKAFGAVTIYSAQADPFTDDEIGLLSRLADDLTFGVKAIRLREANQLAEANLRASEERYRSLFNGMTEGFALHEIICDGLGVPCNYRFLDINPAFERLTGLSRDTVVGRTIADVLPGEEPQWVDIYGGVALTGTPVRFDNYSPGLQKHFEIFAYSPNPGQFAVIFGDVTERMRAENALRESEERLSTTLRSIGDAVLATDAEARVTMMNPVAEALTGWTEHEALGRQIEEVFHIVNEASHEAVESPIARCLKEGQIVGLANHTVLISKDGRTTPIDDSGAPIRDAEGNVLGGILVFRDISLRRQTEEEQRRADRAKDEFLAMLSHELRNPLATISNAAALIEMNAPPSPALRQPVDILNRQVRHTTRLVEDLLDVSRITHGKLELRTQAVDLVALLQRAADAAQQQMIGLGHRFSVNLIDGPLFVQADPTRLEQVVDNLLNNAAKYTDAGGEVTLTLAANEGEAVIRVRDNGRGIDQDMLPRIFDLFTQEERSLDRARGGLGIGLTLVRNLVEMHGGTVEAFSNGPGSGSEFVVRLGICEAVTAEPASPGQPAGAGAINILVVDDNADAAETLAAILDVWGHKVEVVHTGPAALESVRLKRPDVVLLDIGLPGMDGYEVAQRLRDEGSEAMRLIALTGYGQDNDRRRSLSAGFDDHLVKPVDLDVLSELLARCAPDPG